MDLIRDFGGSFGHFGITGVDGAIADWAGGCFAGPALRAFLAGGLGRGWLSIGLFWVGHGKGNASGDKLCRTAMQALQSGTGQHSL